ncbi:hypothetical protein [Apibacter mensalis]|uniref:hypothetical protein n=1 Tax=Apibacter mensalis TaxID=1586267 RepID=UPI0026F2AD78|nr:hypothetical protein [Apibacter mensalis]
MQKRLKKILIKLIIIALCVGCLIFYLFQKRNYYCLAEDKCITVWKTAEGAFIIPGKYTSWFKPKDNYIKTDNLNEYLGIYYNIQTPNNFYVASGIINNHFIIINKCKNINIINVNYDNAERFYDIVNKDKFLKYNIILLTINLKESYAITNDGRIFN